MRLCGRTCAKGAARPLFVQTGRKPVTTHHKRQCHDAGVKTYCFLCLILCRNLENLIFYSRFFVKDFIALEYVDVLLAYFYASIGFCA